MVPILSMSVLGLKDKLDNLWALYIFKFCKAPISVLTVKDTSRFSERKGYIDRQTLYVIFILNGLDIALQCFEVGHDFLRISYQEKMFEFWVIILGRFEI